MSCLPYLISNWPIKKIAVLISMGVGAAYLLLSGASVAKERAYVMAFNIFVAVLAPFGGEGLGLWGMVIGLGAILDVARHVADLPYSISHIKTPPPKFLGILEVSVLFGIFCQG